MADDKDKGQAEAKRPRLAANPTGDAFEAMEDDGARYRTTTNIRGHSPGSIVAARDLGPGAQIDRLVRDGALAPLSDEEAKAHVEAGDHRTNPAFSTGGHTIAAVQATMTDEQKQKEFDDLETSRYGGGVKADKSKATDGSAKDRSLHEAPKGAAQGQGQAAAATHAPAAPGQSPGDKISK